MNFRQKYHSAKEKFYNNYKATDLLRSKYNSAADVEAALINAGFKKERMPDFDKPYNPFDDSKMPMKWGWSGNGVEDVKTGVALIAYYHFEEFSEKIKNKPMSNKVYKTDSSPYKHFTEENMVGTIKSEE